MNTQVPQLTVCIAKPDSVARSIEQAVRRAPGPFLCVASSSGLTYVPKAERVALLKSCRAFNKDRDLFLASKNSELRVEAAKEGWKVVSTLKDLKVLLRKHPQEQEAIRMFNPAAWSEYIRSHLQSIGLLSLPKIRIWFLFILSLLLFIFTFFKVLPSCTIHIWPSQESSSFTTNVYLASSGAVLPVPKDRVRTLPLQLYTVTVHRDMTYDRISKKFTGTDASMNVTVFNDADEAYSLREGTRLVNQAGMRFRLASDVIIEPHSTSTVSAKADFIDMYGDVLGERGNVPADVKWDFPGLSTQERALVYARNKKPAQGGSTSFITVLSKEDIEGTKGASAGARIELQRELLSMARQQVQEEITAQNRLKGTHIVELKREELTKISFHDFFLSEEFIGQQVASIPISGSLTYTVVLYDENALLSLLKDEVRKRVGRRKTIVESSLTSENIDINVIAPWDDNLLWVKITADLTYTETYIINPITPSGAAFAKYIRESVAGKSIEDANRVIKNLPEISSVDIRLWPPWTRVLPVLETSIAIEDEQN